MKPAGDRSQARWFLPVLSGKTYRKIKRGVTDSKLLKEKERVSLFSWIMDNALSVGIGMASHEEIDAINILRQASFPWRGPLKRPG